MRLLIMIQCLWYDHDWRENHITRAVICAKCGKVYRFSGEK